MKTTTITIKVPTDLRTAFKMAALKKDKTMTNILLECIKKTVKEDKNDKILG